MALLCISNGHGEDSIGGGSPLSAGVETVTPAPGTGGLCPIVGEGGIFQKSRYCPGRPSPNLLPSGGFIYYGSNVSHERDLKERMVPLTRQQLATGAANGRKTVGDYSGAGAISCPSPCLVEWGQLQLYRYGPNLNIGCAMKPVHCPSDPWYEGWAGSVYLPLGAVADEPSQMSGPYLCGIN